MMVGRKGEIKLHIELTQVQVLVMNMRYLLGKDLYKLMVKFTQQIYLFPVIQILFHLTFVVLFNVHKYCVVQLFNHKSIARLPPTNKPQQYSLSFNDIQISVVAWTPRKETPLRHPPNVLLQSLDD